MFPLLILEQEPHKESPPHEYLLSIFQSFPEYHLRIPLSKNALQLFWCRKLRPKKASPVVVRNLW